MFCLKPAGSYLHLQETIMQGCIRIQLLTNGHLKSWLVVQNLRIALSRVFISFEAFRPALIKKDRQNGMVISFMSEWLLPL